MENNEIAKRLIYEINKKFNIDLSLVLFSELSSAINEVYYKADNISYEEIESELLICIKNSNKISDLKFQIYESDFKLILLNELLIRLLNNFK